MIRLVKFVTAVIAAALLTQVNGDAAAEANTRALPKPMPAHPGNVFVAGENVILPLPQPKHCRLVDYEGKAMRDLEPVERKVTLGKLPVGFYRIELTGSSNWISLAVLEPLHSPTPLSSPIGIDVAMAWFYRKEQMDAVANLCALAGVNWVRDRLSWAEMEPEQGMFSGANKYDASAAVQNGAGLRVLQVIHQSPAWANPKPKRFPLDLRDAYRFFEAMAKRWRGQMQAFEPWNEADIPMFGGHTGAEMATLQKAAYLGLKAGNSNLTVCLNVFALHKANQLADLQDNEAWPYIETYNLHHYEPFENFPRLYADHRSVSAGRPLWVSECAVPVKWTGDEKLKEPSDADLRVQAERVAKTFAWSLHEGSRASFYFLLPHYVEGGTQFGILRPDLTPRPAYVAMAAVGRLLADARPLGRLEVPDKAVRAFAFQAWPDGGERDVLVAWTTNHESVLALRSTPLELFDHLGRKRSPSNKLNLSAAPLFAVLPDNAAGELGLIPPPPSPRRLEGSPSPIVFQALWPDDKIDLNRSAYRVPEQSVEMQVFAYNFGSHTVRGQLAIEASNGWEATLPREIELDPMQRKELTLSLTAPLATPDKIGHIRLRGDFGAAGKPVLSLRVVSDRGEARNGKAAVH